jgi:hypothetical protein
MPSISTLLSAAKPGVPSTTRRALTPSVVMTDTVCLQGQPWGQQAKWGMLCRCHVGGVSSMGVRMNVGRVVPLMADQAGKQGYKRMSSLLRVTLNQHAAHPTATALQTPTHSVPRT